MVNPINLLTLLNKNRKPWLRIGCVGLFLLLVGSLLSACSSAPAQRSPAAGGQVRVVPKVTRGHYVVRRGDTLYSIARRHGWEWQALAWHNRIASPYNLKIGQVIRFGALPRQSSARAAPAPRRPINAKRPAVAVKPKASHPANVNKARPTVSKAPAQTARKTAPPAKPSKPNTPHPAQKTASSAALSAVKWQWPSNGALIGRFAQNKGLSKGIDIAGSAGQPVKAAADGLVTYAGNGLYGNGAALVIKHGASTVISVYGHNRRLLVKEGQQVKAGQIIAEMGASGTDRVKLHFEIRHQGQPVDPLTWLPKR